MLSLAF